MPINLLQNSIKLTNEPPEGLRPNLIRAFNTFNEEMLESCAKQVCVCLVQHVLAWAVGSQPAHAATQVCLQVAILLCDAASAPCGWCKCASTIPVQAEFRSIIFALCYFHAALLERKKFGVGNLPGATSGIGWNMNYPFNTGDLLCCGQCAANYLENNVKVC